MLDAHKQVEFMAESTGPIVKGDAPWWAEPFQQLQITPIVAWLSIILLVASLVLGIWTAAQSNFNPVKDQSQSIKACCSDSRAERQLNQFGKWKAGVLVFWLLAPPIWFWIEYFAIYRFDPNAREDWDYFKYSQDVSSKIWLAAVTALTILYFGKDLKP
jgi:hypothetical protein